MTYTCVARGRSRALDCARRVAARASGRAHLANVAILSYSSCFVEQSKRNAVGKGDKEIDLGRSIS
jgi:hypothetical protein